MAIVNITSEAFKLIVCDGPDMSKTPQGNPIRTPPSSPYIPCDFKAVMDQVQHLINIMLVLGVVAAIGGLCYAGYLYISGTEQNINKAKDILPKLAWGFIIMLSAWFIVYQILSWLTGNSGFTRLLGSPN